MMTPSEMDTLRALLNRLVPPDDYPGGWDAGVGDYLLRQLAGDLQSYAEMYRAGLQGIDAEAQGITGQSFAALDAQQQAGLLARIESGTVETTWQTDPAQFFQTAVDHCMEGYYSDPGNGGNRNSVAWDMIGFEVTA